MMIPGCIWYCWWFRNPAAQPRPVVHPIIYRVLYIPGGAGFLPSTVSLFCVSNCPYPQLSEYPCTIVIIQLAAMHSFATESAGEGGGSLPIIQEKPSTFWVIHDITSYNVNVFPLQNHNTNLRCFRNRIHCMKRFTRFTLKKKDQWKPKTHVPRKGTRTSKKMLQKSILLESFRIPRVLSF